MMDLSKIQDLKRRLAECTDFVAFWEYYFDNFAENREFINLGRQVTGRRMHQILGEVAVRVLGKTELELRKPVLVEQPESNLVHGSCMVEGKVICILFFSDLDLGMAAVSELSGTFKTTYCRFSTTPAQAIAAAN